MSIASTWMNVTFFNEFGDAYEKPLLDNDNDDLVIVISAANIHKFDGTYNM